MPADMSSQRSRVVTALFREPEQVERAYQAALDAGYEIGDINIVMSDETRRRFYADSGRADSDVAKKSAEGGELGGPTGGRVGLAISIVAAIGAALVIPGLGLVMAGPLAVALAGAGAAGVAAGLIGALADWGLPDPRVRDYEAEIARGAILVGVKVRFDDDARRIAQAWKAIGGWQLEA